jgi:uncharacterized RDD family membrane protein YckC
VLTPEFETASWVRRILALFVDWAASTLVVIAVLGLDDYSTSSAAGLYVLLVYVVESALFTWLVGGSFGKVATRLRVVPADGRLRPHNPLKILVRQVLIALVIPPLVFRPDGRGLHDLFAGTATVTLDTYRSLLGRARP